jgi:hypothetical protein
VTKRTTRLSVWALLIVMAVCASAYATPQYKLILRNPMPAATGYIWTTGMSAYENCYIGPVTLEVRQLNTTTGAYDFLGYQRTLCVDILGTITANCTWYADVVTGVPNCVLGATEAEESANWDRVVWMAQKNPGWTVTSGTDPVPFDAVQNAGIQVAVWEVMRDGSNWNLTSGNFKATSFSNGQIPNSAYGFFTASADFTLGYGTNHGYFEATNWDENGNKLPGYGQDQLFFIPEFSGPPPIPEIPAAMLCPLGLLAIGAIRRRFAK